MKETKLTEEERLAVIAQAVKNVKTNQPWTQSIEDFVAEIRAEQLVVEHGLSDAKEEDVQDEVQFLYSDTAEAIDEEDLGFGLSDEMKEVYN